MYMYLPSSGECIGCMYNTSGFNCNRCRHGHVEFKANQFSHPKCVLASTVGKSICLHIHMYSTCKWKAWQIWNDYRVYCKQYILRIWYMYLSDFEFSAVKHAWFWFILLEAIFVSCFYVGKIQVLTDILKEVLTCILKELCPLIIQST